MTFTNNQHCDEFDLLYVLGKHAWSDLYFVISGEVHGFRITHIFSDPIDDLVELCSSLIDRADTSIRLYDEPGATLIRVTTNPNQRHLSDISVFSEQALNSADLQFRVTVKANQLIIQIVHQLYKLEALFKEKSYSTDRGEFPQKAFQALIAKLEKNMNTPT